MMRTMTTTDPHAEARALFEDYATRADRLKRNRVYARAVADATSGESKTPVEPLATMGRRGGPLRCDGCGDPMILEGGSFQGVHADVAWARNPVRGWRSYIAGGMVILIETNGTLRVYHGYPNSSGCVKHVERIRDAAKDLFARQHGSATEKLACVRAYLKAELPALHNDKVMGDIYKVMFVFDPGLGVNALD